jgi:hypothetical protein
VVKTVKPFCVIVLRLTCGLLVATSAFGCVESAPCPEGMVAMGTRCVPAVMEDRGPGRDAALLPSDASVDAPPDASPPEDGSVDAMSIDAGDTDLHVTDAGMTDHMPRDGGGPDARPLRDGGDGDEADAGEPADAGERPDAGERADAGIEPCTPRTFHRDSDGDGYGHPSSTRRACLRPEGYVDNGDDCDDGCRECHPGATEICDGANNDCDTQIDEGVLITYFEDRDGDGFGIPGAVTTACSRPEGYVRNNDDCDDTCSVCFDGAGEACDGEDNDCDGRTDEGVRSTFWVDGDNDGYGDPGRPRRACRRSGNLVSNDDDCNDEVRAINPGAAERCDGVDNDCDMSTDGPDSVDALSFYLDDDGDGFGDPTASTRACSAPAGYVRNDNDCNDACRVCHDTATEVCDGVDNNCNGVPEDEEAVDRDSFYRDADGDGYGDRYDRVSRCSAPSGYVTTTGDCDDDPRTGADVHPEASYSTDPRPGTSDNYDWNCDRFESARPEETGFSCDATCSGDGWEATSAPACGGSGTFVTCVRSSFGGCLESSRTRAQMCR